jgi:CBS domain-containing protein
MRHLLTVADVMTRELVSVTDETPYKTVVAALAENKVSAVPVIDGFGDVAGVVSETDLLRKEQFQRTRRPVWLLRWWRHGLRRKAAALTAGQLMSRPAVTVEGGCTLDEAARLMAARDITRLMVVDDDQLVGIVARSDLLRAFLASDPEILARVRRDVVQHVLWDDPLAVEVTVTDGVVTLAGQVEHRSTVEVAERLTREVDGVVGVPNELTWLFDDTVPAAGTTGTY